MVGSLELASGLEILTDLMEEVDKMCTVVRAWHETLSDDPWYAKLKGACGDLLSEMAPLVEMVNQHCMVDIDKTVLLAQTSTSRFREEYAKLKTYMEKAIKEMPTKQQPAARVDEDEFDYHELFPKKPKKQKRPASSSQDPPPAGRRELAKQTKPAKARAASKKPAACESAPEDLSGSSTVSPRPRPAARPPPSDANPKGAKRAKAGMLSKKPAGDLRTPDPPSRGASAFDNLDGEEIFETNHEHQAGSLPDDALAAMLSQHLDING